MTTWSMTTRSITTVVDQVEFENNDQIKDSNQAVMTTRSRITSTSLTLSATRMRETSRRSTSMCLTLRRRNSTADKRDQEDHLEDVVELNLEDEGDLDIITSTKGANGNI
mmetsp:Transcript_9042/g.19596  ORF Transcript_9042/g.19596 Transcript_9042/m.19596 type:complete len:110 (+) Transcript_9042:1015-1344(+)